MASRVIYTFLLKGVNPQKLLADYQAGFFAHPKEPLAQLTMVQDTPVMAPTYGENYDSPIFTLRDRNNNSVIIATSGHTNYEIFTKNGGQLPAGGLCDNCGKTFNHEAVGYPVAYLEQTVLVPENGQHVYRNFYIFWVEGTFCDSHCALFKVKQMTMRPADQRDVILRDSESLLRLMYHLMYPEAGPLLPSNDPRLLKSKQGSLDDETWANQRRPHHRTNRVIMVPVKVEYLQQKIEKMAITQQAATPSMDTIRSA